MNAIFVALFCLYNISDSFAYDLGVGYRASVRLDCFLGVERLREMAIMRSVMFLAEKCYITFFEDPAVGGQLAKALMAQSYWLSPAYANSRQRRF